MPADDCPSFHCRPSTASTLLPRSFSTRQTPTTGSRDLGSAPAVSFVKSILTDCCAAAERAAMADATITVIWMIVFILMVYLLFRNPIERRCHCRSLRRLHCKGT